MMLPAANIHTTTQALCSTPNIKSAGMLATQQQQYSAVVVAAQYSRKCQAIDPWSMHFISDGGAQEAEDQHACRKVEAFAGSLQETDRSSNKGDSGSVSVMELRLVFVQLVVDFGRECMHWCVRAATRKTTTVS
jgi:hypothetical protein